MSDSFYTSQTPMSPVTSTVSVFAEPPGDDFTPRQRATLAAAIHDHVSRVQYERYRELQRTVDSLSSALTVVLAFLLIDTVLLVAIGWSLR